jgi:hypothetical protein
MQASSLSNTAAKVEPTRLGRCWEAKSEAARLLVQDRKGVDCHHTVRVSRLRPDPLMEFPCARAAAGHFGAVDRRAHRKPAPGVGRQRRPRRFQNLGLPSLAIRVLSGGFPPRRYFLVPEREFRAAAARQTPVAAALLTSAPSGSRPTRPTVLVRRDASDFFDQAKFQSSDVCARVSSSRESAFAASRASPSAAALFLGQEDNFDHYPP